MKPHVIFYICDLQDLSVATFTTNVNDLIAKDISKTITKNNEQGVNKP